MRSASYIIAANYLVTDDRLVAAAVVDTSVTAEPSFTYTLYGRNRTAFLFQRGDKIPEVLYASIDDHIRTTSLSWSVVSAHPNCPPESALALAVVRAIERWVCREDDLPSLTALFVQTATKRILPALPSTLNQEVNVKNWRVAAARALCRHHVIKRDYATLDYTSR